MRRGARRGALRICVPHSEPQSPKTWHFSLLFNQGFGSLYPIQRPFIERAPGKCTVLGHFGIMLKIGSKIVFQFQKSVLMIVLD